jgi:tetratricopeptide (TPR) repeat protein
MTWLDDARAWLERWRVMREMRAMERRDREGQHWDFAGMINEAQDVLERGNRPRATELWTRAYATFPGMAMKSPTALDFLLRFQLYDEAEAMMTVARKRYPHRAHALEGLAMVAYKRGNHEVAVQRCEPLRKKHPSSLVGYWVAAAALADLGRSIEAEAMLASGIRVAPQDVGLRLEFAKLAERGKDWPEALKRWTEVYGRYGHLAGVVGSANALKELGRYDEADQHLSAVMYKAGNDLSVWLEYARIAEHKRDWEDAVCRWEGVRKRFPMLPMVYVSGLRPLLELGRHSDVETVLLSGIERVPDDPSALIELAWIAHRRGDWPEAENRWATVRERFPKRREGYERGSEVLSALGRTAEALQIRNFKLDKDPAAA